MLNIRAFGLDVLGAAERAKSSKQRCPALCRLAIVTFLAFCSR